MIPDPVRRALPDGARVARWRAPDGWELRRFDWPASGASQGSILFQGGRGDIFEKYLEAFAHWQARGWSITSFDWRGQGGSGRLSANPHVGHVGNFAVYLRDLRAFWSDWQATAPAPRIVIGHSMGGFLLLQGMLDGAIDPAAAVLVAPMLGLRSPLGATAGEYLARLLGRVGDPARSAWSGNERPGVAVSRQALLTHDSSRYGDEGWWHGQQPELVLGPPSWRWLIQAFAWTRRLREDRRLRRLRVPMLMLVAEADRLVDARSAIAVAGALPDARLLRFGSEAAHEILREADPVRNRALGEIDIFLASRVSA